MRNPTHHDLDTLARTLYGEAESDNCIDAIAIAWVILNRARLPNWPDSITGVCLQSWAFSCWNIGDPNRSRILAARGEWFKHCQRIAADVVNGAIPDPTVRSTHYYATFIKEPKWARGHTPVYGVKHRRGDEHRFFNDIDTPAPKP